ncbi:MAG TPA: ribonuclease III domain-containing protein [Holophaga sp.]|nr:ribonuclease III domain-containing protein [Holophaga sp.]
MKREAAPLHRLETALGYRFHDPALLRTALTPPSTGLSPNNQRLEYLGDAILQLCVTELIFREKPDWDEGAMSKLTAMLVCTHSLCDWALALDLSLETGPRSGKKPSSMGGKKPRADAVEALVAAVFLDAKGSGLDPLAVVSGLVSARFLAPIREARIGAWEERDSKTTLQERAAALSLPAPSYELVARGGPDHAPTFTVRAHVGTLEGLAKAGTLKQAQAEAARAILRQLASPSH